MLSMQFTQRVDAAFAVAHELASSKRHASLEPVHLAQVMIQDDQAMLSVIAAADEKGAKQLAAALGDAVESLPTLSNPQTEVAASPALQRFSQRAQTLAQQSGDELSPKIGW
jgi:ATP-dependent Clp protease ATP-binding subunit ClpB